MKLNLKLVAIAAAMVAAGAANAGTTSSSSGNGSFVLYAYNTVTTGWYIRDLGPLLNDFLPSFVAPVTGDNPNQGDKTPETGLNFTVAAADTVFSSWLGGSNLSSIKWGAFAGDSLTAGSNGVARMIYTSTINPSVTNAQLVTAVGNTQLNGLAGPGNVNLNGGSLSFVSGVPAPITGDGLIGAANLTTLGTSANLYYYTRTVQSGSNATPANEFLFANSQNSAFLTLDSSGAVNYAIAPVVSQVPLPGAAWLMGAGLLAVGGMIRRRKASAEA